jgi:hypothetical protein
MNERKAEMKDKVRNEVQDMKDKAQYEEEYK